MHGSRPWGLWCKRCLQADGVAPPLYYVPAHPPSLATHHLLFSLQQRGGVQPRRPVCHPVPGGAAAAGRRRSGARVSGVAGTAPLMHVAEARVTCGSAAAATTLTDVLTDSLATRTGYVTPAHMGRRWEGDKRVHWPARCTLCVRSGGGVAPKARMCKRAACLLLSREVSCTSAAWDPCRGGSVRQPSCSLAALRRPGAAFSATHSRWVWAEPTETPHSC